MGSIRTRLGRLEGQGARCPECRDSPQAIHPYYPDKGEPEPEPERCSGCGRPLGIIFRVVYGEEGEGTTVAR